MTWALAAYPSIAAQAPRNDLLLNRSRSIMGRDWRRSTKKNRQKRLKPPPIFEMVESFNQPSELASINPQTMQNKPQTEARHAGYIESDGVKISGFLDVPRRYRKQNNSRRNIH